MTDLDSRELTVVVALAVLLMGWLSRRTGLSEPLPLLAVGTLVGPRAGPAAG
ncbi:MULTISPECIES: hypothetical protein [unclassified Streptomyces]|uniref:hypothetical protein n=1 Tax=unclassified Streptomyces TaxID=2593676 RepID=UPI00403C136F